MTLSIYDSSLLTEYVYHRSVDKSGRSAAYRSLGPLYGSGFYERTGLVGRFNGQSIQRSVGRFNGQSVAYRSLDPLYGSGVRRAALGDGRPRLLGRRYQLREAPL